MYTQKKGKINMKVYVIRHGMTDWNTKKLLQGRSDIPLNETGRKEALLVKSKINISNIDLVYSSPLKRAYETAKIIVGSKEIKKSDLLLERSFGLLEGSKIDLDALSKYWDYFANASDNDVEPLKDVIKRAHEFKKILLKSKEKSVLVVTHGAFMKCLDQVLKDSSDYDFSLLRPKNTEIYEYEI